jgi:hypothetical protein
LNTDVLLQNTGVTNVLPGYIYFIMQRIYQCHYYKTQCDHDNHCTDPTRGLSTAVKLFVQQKFNDGITKSALAILNLILQNKMPEPPKVKLINFLKTVREKKFGPPSVSATELRTWCDERKSIPEDLDEPFVVASTIHAESTLLEEQDLKIVFSTKRLLSIARKLRMIQADATYKLLWQGFPVIIVGTSDKDNVFHPYLLAVIKGETCEDFSFVFRALHEYNLEWKPSILLGDASEAITNAFVNVFGIPAVRIMCYFHMLHNIEKYLKPLTKGGICVLIKLDIEALQHCSDEQTFIKASNLFIQKWQEKNDPRITTFLEYMKDQWLTKNAS